MSSIPPTLKYVEGFTVTGFSTNTQNTDEFNQKTAKLPNLWDQFYSSELASTANRFGVYSNYESDTNGLYTVTAGVTGDLDHTTLDSVKVHAGNYLVFQGKGPMPQAIVEVWQQIWAYFAAENPYQRNFISDFEAYSGADEIAIYIGIQ